MNALLVKKELKTYINKEKKAFLPKFFRAHPGGYGEGDKFLGVVVPDQRRIAKKYKNLALSEIETLLKSKYHEERLTGLFILTIQFEQSKDKEKEKLAKFYIKNISSVNNWDLVDSTAHKILGPYLINKDKKLLYEWVDSNSIWKRRTSIMTTFYFIKYGNFQDTLKLASKLLDDREDLIHKAVGWMLREIGKNDVKTLEKFLRNNYKKMPRVMLRYSIEKMPTQKRIAYLRSEI